VSRTVAKDPQLQTILRDPTVQQLIRDLKSDPKAAQAALERDSGLEAKIEKLLAAGVLRTGARRPGGAPADD